MKRTPNAFTRLKYIACSGEAYLWSDQDLDQAEHFFCKGLKVAREQKAKSLELKTLREYL